ncbi:TenA family transcriptional regulator [Aquitalea palustris]|uniref:TenA family transcriptional regulator n=1 Tax=Aquitalea palustris TaxID=2480983 RepID=A0A454JLH8_9NEIS|nr:iron-containing redox enzyme family protein [Aquitalea palustris]RMD00686.1 TenA family transcriptional regulator [Aquitalea palustris]
MKDQHQFVRTGPLMEVASYPEWTQEMVHYCDRFKSEVVEHDLFTQMKEARLEHSIHKAFLSGGWPVIDQFPQYMAMNLLKIRYGQGEGHDMARRYLIRNIRVEQNHADHWVNWATESGVDIQAMLHNQHALETLSLSQWCWQVCDRESLAVAMAATNYAIEGATGEWSARVCSEDRYANLFDEEGRAKAMKWLKLHAKYDDAHPWEALEIIVTLVGLQPSQETIIKLRNAICKSHQFMRLLLDHYMRPLPQLGARPQLALV